MHKTDFFNKVMQVTPRMHSANFYDILSEDFNRIDAQLVKFSRGLPGSTRRMVAD